MSRSRLRAREQLQGGLADFGLPIDRDVESLRARHLGPVDVGQSQCHGASGTPFACQHPFELTRELEQLVAERAQVQRRLGQRALLREGLCRRSRAQRRDILAERQGAERGRVAPGKLLELFLWDSLKITDRLEAARGELLCRRRTQAPDLGQWETAQKARARRHA